MSVMTTSELMTAGDDLRAAKALDDGMPVGPFHVRVLQGHANLWFAIACPDRDVMAVRVGGPRPHIVSAPFFKV